MKNIIFFDFDLDLSAKKRWEYIFDYYAYYLPKLSTELKRILDSFGLVTSLVKPIYTLTRSSNIMFYDEICYVAKRIGIEPSKALLMQLIYETSSACTATVLKIGTKDFFFRTMDWSMMFLKDITIGLNIKKDGRYIGKVTTWLGYVGFLTTTNIINNYTITINYCSTTEISITSLAKKSLPHHWNEMANRIFG